MSPILQVRIAYAVVAWCWTVLFTLWLCIAFPIKHIHRAYLQTPTKDAGEENRGSTPDEEDLSPVPDHRMDYDIQWGDTSFSDGKYACRSCRNINLLCINRKSEILCENPVTPATHIVWSAAFKIVLHK